MDGSGKHFNGGIMLTAIGDVMRRCYERGGLPLETAISA